MLEELLEYQNLDAQVFKLEKQIENDVNKQNLAKLSAVIKNLQSKLLELDGSAGKSIAEYNSAKSEFDKKTSEIDTLSKGGEQSVEDYTVSLSKLGKIVTTLSNMERLLSSQAESVSTILKNFDYCKNSIVSNKEKYKECKDKSVNTETTLVPQIERLKGELLQKEKTLSPALLSRYKKLRQSNVWPVLVPLRNGACGGCAMGLSSALLSQVHSEGHIECEQCGRIIYDN